MLEYYSQNTFNLVCYAYLDRTLCPEKFLVKKIMHKFIVRVQRQDILQWGAIKVRVSFDLPANIELNIGILKDFWNKWKNDARTYKNTSHLRENWDSVWLVQKAHRIHACWVFYTIHILRCKCKINPRKKFRNVAMKRQTNPFNR